jgi:thiamine-phosphate pyrophosphorylase
MSGALAPLMVVTDRRATGDRSLANVVEAALRGGARLVQLREKDLDSGPLLALARELRELTRRFDARLLVNDRIEVALAAEADGVVLPARSFATDDARSLLGAERWIGRSTHSAEEARRAAAEGADFALFGPVFATPAKAAFGEPQGLERLGDAARTGIPIYAVGGITSENAASCRAAGAHGVAVIREVMSAAEPAGSVRRLLCAKNTS